MSGDALSKGCETDEAGKFHIEKLLRRRAVKLRRERH